MKAVLLASVILMIGGGECTSEVCPTIPTIKIDNSDIVGEWTAIWESTSPRLPCLHYNVSLDDDGYVELEFLPYGITAVGVPTNSSDSTQGNTITISLALINGGHQSIFAFKKDNYLGQVVCKRTDSVDYFSVTLWAKKGYTLTTTDKDEMDAALAKSEVVVTTFKKIYHGAACGIIDPVIGIVSNVVSTVASLI